MLAATEVPAWLDRTESLYSALKASVLNRKRGFVVFGQAGSGKTTALFQALLRLDREISDVVLYEISSDVRSLRSALNLILKLHKDGYVVAYIHDASVFGDTLVDDLLSIDAGRITLVTSARSGEWREHIERRLGHIAEPFLYERFVENDHNALIDRLVNFVPSPSFLKMSKAGQLQKLRSSKSQLLIALREATESQSFNAVISKEFLSLPDDDCRLLFVIVGISTIARSGIQEGDARAAYERLSRKRSFANAMIALEGIVIKDASRRLWGRHELYVRHIVENVVEYEVILESIIEVLRNFTKFEIPIVKTVGRLDSVLFKFLLNHNFNAEHARSRHREEEGRRIYEEFEIDFQLDGHFWLQFGQYLVAIGEEEDALSALGKSIKAYPDNPYAVHAFADLQLRVAANRPKYDSATQQLVKDAVRSLEAQHHNSYWESDQYPIVTLAEKHIHVLVKHEVFEEARICASKYYREIESLVRSNSAQPLQRARERLAHYLTKGYWNAGPLRLAPGKRLRRK